MSIWVQKIIIIIVVNIMECLSCARQGSKYFTQFWSLQTSYNIGNIIAVFEMMELRPRRVKQQSWSHRGRKGQNSDSTQGVWPRTCAMLQSPPHSCLPDGCSFIHSRILHFLGRLVYAIWGAQSTFCLKVATQKSCLPCRYWTSILTWISSLLAHSIDFRFASSHNGVSWLLEISLSR